MKISGLVVVFMLFVQGLGFTQNRYLILKNKFDDSIKEISENKKVKVIYNGNMKSKGHLKIISESLILVDKDTIELSQIEVIKYQPKIANIIGGVLVTHGVTYMFLSIIIKSTNEQRYTGYIPASALAMGSLIQIGFGIGLMNSPLKFRKNLWKYSIRIK